MARLLSPIASIMRGSVAGLTFTANQFHQIVVRARTAPVQPNTTPQTDIRTAFTSAEANWEGMSDIERSAWQDYADFTPYSGPLGDYTVTGRLMFHAVFGLLFYMNDTLGAGMSTDDAPPASPGFAQLPNFQLGPPGLGDDGVRVNGVIPIFADDTFMFAQRSIAFTDTRRRFKGPWLSSTNQAVDFVAGVPGEIDFIGLNVGDVIFIRLRGILTDAPHRIAQEIILRGVAEAGAA